MAAESAVLVKYAIFGRRSEGVLDDFMMLAQGKVQTHIEAFGLQRPTSLEQQDQAVKSYYGASAIDGNEGMGQHIDKTFLPFQSGQRHTCTSQFFI